MAMTFLARVSSLIWKKSDLHVLFENIVDGQEVPLKYNGKLVGIATVKKNQDGSVSISGDFTTENALNELIKSGGFSVGLRNMLDKENEQGGEQNV